MLDVKREQEIAEKWLNQRASDCSMDIDTLVEVTINGNEMCTGYCHSREKLEFDSCRCIRSIFPHDTHYSLYQVLRKLFKELLVLDYVLESNTGEKYDGKPTSSIRGRT